MIAVAIVAMAVPAFSAVENIKVGGDLIMYGINRHDFMFDGDTDNDLFQTSTRVYVQAQLTDGVEAMVRLINERFWGTLSGYDGLRARGDNGSDEIVFDLAYIKVSNLGIDGLDLTLGRQEIQFGEGLVVGSSYLPFDYYPGNSMNWGAAPDLGVRKAFDAVRVDYKAATAPVDATAFMARTSETRVTSSDVNLYGLNLGFNLNENARLEGYYVRIQNMSDIDMNITTLGVRATGDFAGLGLKGEYARQIGTILPGIDNEGWALLLGGQYNFEAAVSGNIHANLNLYSGQDSSGDNTAWTTLFPANTASRIGAINYALITYWAGAAGLNNAQVINIGASIKPVEKICLGLDWFNLKAMEDTFPYMDSAIGNEIDAHVTYNYTEDLSFGLQYGIMMIGDGLEWFYDSDPWQLIASAKLAF